MLRKLWADKRGVFAVEMAICFPVVIIAMGGGIDIAQKQALLRNSQFTIQAAAMAGQSQVQSIVAANAVLFMPGWTYTTSVVNNGATFTATLDSAEPALFPMFGDTVTATATVTVAVASAQ